MRIAFALFASLIAAPVARADDAPRLRDLVAVTAEVVRIGDLIENAGDAAAIAVFRAPNLGDTGSVPVATVRAALRRHAIDVPAGDIGDIVVTRLSRAFDAREIGRQIAQAIGGRQGFGDADTLAIMLDRPMRTLHLDADTADLAVLRLNADARSGRFDIVFDLPAAGESRRQSMRLTGVATESVETAVLLRPLAKNNVVTASDVAMERRPKSSSEPIEADRVIGLSAKRALRAGQVLTFADVVKPETIGRNEVITLVHQMPGLMLTVRGKALEPGAIGDTISVVNLQSNRTIQGVVAGPGRVTLAGPRPVFASAQPHTP